MNNNLSKPTYLLTIDDQLTLLKDSIDLRFNHKNNNEFASLGQGDPLKKFEFSDTKKREYPLFRPDAITFKNDTRELDELLERIKTKRHIRYISCVVILFSLFTPFLNIMVGAGDTILGLSLVSTFVELAKQPSLITKSGSDLFVALYPALLVIYAGSLAFLPNGINKTKARTRFWSITAGSGIFFFFVALTLFTAESNLHNAISTIGYGYYLSMAAIFAYHFLTQFAEQSMVNPQTYSSTAKL